jgi:antitoxin component YwqK of YwqJK toxin-antitoxin module
MKMVYYVDGKLHNESGPAFTRFYKSGSLEFEKYYIRGSLHRIGKPAEITYDEGGELKSNKYYIEGQSYKIGESGELIYDIISDNFKSGLYTMYTKPKLL